ncbi:MAG TPA: class I SAM-dependent methyltransferase [Ferruginibacter sp.]|nr:class I SAM-dependent methyltransferase [Ferruginibacter sp.]HMP19755.1 class I SAM-dependent methyltransferase [Ferruginibacter sp.]
MNRLENIPDKFEDKRTTTKKFKQDLFDFVNETKVKTILEIGCYNGYTAHILHPVLKKMTCVDYNFYCIEKAKKLNTHARNIYYRWENVYNAEWKYGYHDLVIIDCGHSEEHLISDIENTMSVVKSQYIVFDDYGLFPEVKKVIDRYITENKFLLVKKIGAQPGTLFYMSTSNHTTEDKKLAEYEGVICKVLKS